MSFEDYDIMITQKMKNENQACEFGNDTPQARARVVRIALLYVFVICTINKAEGSRAVLEFASLPHTQRYDTNDYFEVRWMIGGENMKNQEINNTRSAYEHFITMPQQARNMKREERHRSCVCFSRAYYPYCLNCFCIVVAWAAQVNEYRVYT